MLKIFMLCVFFSPILVIGDEDFENSTTDTHSTLDEVFNKSTTVFVDTPKRNESCVTSYDCIDLRMVCSKNRTCVCAKFHDRMGQKCVANITRIYRWLRSTMSTVPETVSQPVDFQIVQVEPYTILAPRWSEYEYGVQDTETERMPRIVWPLVFGIVLIIIVYGAILLEIL